MESIKADKLAEVNSAVLERRNIFESKSAGAQKASRVMGHAAYKAGDAICVQGDVGNCMYIIVSGEVKVMIRDDSARAEALRKARDAGDEDSSVEEVWNDVHHYFKYDYFGEIALMNSDSLRTASCIAVTDCECLYLHRIHFNAMPSLAAVIGMKNMFSNFGSRQLSTDDNSQEKEERRRMTLRRRKNARKRQVAVMVALGPSEGEEDEEMRRRG